MIKFSSHDFVLDEFLFQVWGIDSKDVIILKKFNSYIYLLQLKPKINPKNLK